MVQMPSCFLFTGMFWPFVDDQADEAGLRLC